MPGPVIRLNLSEAEAERLHGWLGHIESLEPDALVARLRRELAEQARVIDTARANPNLDTLRPLSQVLIRDVHSALPPFCGALLLVFEFGETPESKSAMVYTATPGFNRQDAGAMMQDLLNRWKKLGDFA